MKASRANLFMLTMHEITPSVNCVANSDKRTVDYQLTVHFSSAVWSILAHCLV